MLSKLDPRLRKMLLSPPDKPIRVLVEIAPAIDRASLQGAFQRAGAKIHSWSDEGRLVTLEIAATGIAALSSMPEVVYIEAAERFGE
jgi:hypothetical protein